jgi:hypothetical protein
MFNSTYELVRVTLSSGNSALYECAPNHMPREGIPDSRQWPIMYGKQIAVKLGATWHKSAVLDSSMPEITDAKAISILESFTEV